jgi:cysteine desulfurase/selenocysteine lyase
MNGMAERGSGTVDDLLSELRQNRADAFPVTRSWRYFDHASFGPLPAVAVEAASRALSTMSGPGPGGTGARELMEAVRTEAATLLKSRPENIALLTSTSDAISLVAAGLDWRFGDEVVVGSQEFPSALAPWLPLRSHGVDVVAPSVGAGGIHVEDVERAMTGRTRVVCLSMVDFATGRVAPVAELADLCRRRGAWLVVDAVQAIGAMPVDASRLGADIVAAHGYKFLMGGFGVALVHCSDRAVAELRPHRLGWKNAYAAHSARWVAEEVPPPESSARRFEPSLLAPPTLAALHASLCMLNRWSDAAFQAVSETVRQLATELRHAGYRLECEKPAGPIVSTTHDHLSSEEICASLAGSGIVTSVRRGRLRLSPHFYNLAEDVDELIRHLPR